MTDKEEKHFIRAMNTLQIVTCFNLVFIVLLKEISNYQDRRRPKKQSLIRAKYVRVGEVIPMVFGKLNYVKSISLNAELNLISFKLNSGTSIIRDFDDTLPTLGNLYACEAM